MIICGLKLTHDGAIALIDNGQLKFSYEMEKLNNNGRFSSLSTYYSKEFLSEILGENGYIFAKKIKSSLEKISDINPVLCQVKIDKKNPQKEIKTTIPEEEYINKSVVLVDDVLNSGTTLIYSVKHFLNVPLKQFKTAV